MQQHYRPVISVHKWFARRPGSLFRALALAELVDEPAGGTYAPATSSRASAWTRSWAAARRIFEAPGWACRSSATTPTRWPAGSSNANSKTSAPTSCAPAGEPVAPTCSARSRICTAPTARTAALTRTRATSCGCAITAAPAARASAAGRHQSRVGRDGPPPARRALLPALPDADRARPGQARRSAAGTAGARSRPGSSRPTPRITAPTAASPTASRRRAPSRRRPTKLIAVDYHCAAVPRQPGASQRTYKTADAATTRSSAPRPAGRARRQRSGPTR